MRHPTKRGKVTTVEEQANADGNGSNVSIAKPTRKGIREEFQLGETLFLFTGAPPIVKSEVRRQALPSLSCWH